MAHNEDQKRAVWITSGIGRVVDGEWKTEVIIATSEETQGGEMKEEKPRN